MIKLSVIIVNFNTYEFLTDCLTSIYRSDFPKESMEIIVVDNASRESKIKNIEKEFPGIILIDSIKNLGFAKANNLGIKKAKGKYILLLNPDTVLHNATLSEMVQFMDNNEKVGVSTCKILLASGELDDACHRGFPTPWNAFCHFSGLSRIFPESLIMNGYHLGFRYMDKIHEIESCAGAFLLTRKEMGDSIGWLDEDYFWYGEDIDFCYRIKQKGWKIMYVPTVYITHYKGVSGGIKKHTSGITTADEKTKIMATKARFEVMRIFYQKHYNDKYPNWLTWLVLEGIKIKEYISLLMLKS